MHGAAHEPEQPNVLAVAVAISCETGVFEMEELDGYTCYAVQLQLCEHHRFLAACHGHASTFVSTADHLQKQLLGSSRTGTLQAWGMQHGRWRKPRGSWRTCTRREMTCNNGWNLRSELPAAILLPASLPATSLRSRSSRAPGDPGRHKRRVLVACKADNSVAPTWTLDCFLKRAPRVVQSGLFLWVLLCLRGGGGL